MTVVVDTNVAVVASGLHSGADVACESACVQRLNEIMQRGGLILDELGLILDEYCRGLGRAGKPGAGRAFVKWACDLQWTPGKVTRVGIKRRDDHGWRRFAEFPDREDLSTFDPSDQKFVAVALASRLNPVILNAVDSDYWDHEAALTACGVRTENLCPRRKRRGR